MADERLKKQWTITTAILESAGAEVSTASGYSAYREYIEHNELELALNALMDLGEQNPVSADYWWNLKKAAEVMGLRSHYGELRQRLRTSRNAS
jgi:hypothetical protein